MSKPICQYSSCSSDAKFRLFSNTESPIDVCGRHVAPSLRWELVEKYGAPREITVQACIKSRR